MFNRILNRVCRSGIHISRRWLADEIGNSGDVTKKLRSVPVLTGERGVNKVVLVGRCGRDPEQRGSEDHPVTIFPMATSQSYKSQDGQYTQYTDWHKIVILRKVLADIVYRTLHKGDKVYVSGSINYNRIVDKETSKPITIAQIRADDVMVLTKQTKIDAAELLEENEDQI